jgi:hypothetical protein
MAVRSKDLAPKQEQLDEIQRRLARRQTETQKAEFAGKKWDELTPPQRERLLKALAIHFGFIQPD